MIALVRSGFTRREILDEVRPGRPYAGWSVREFIYHVRLSDKAHRESEADRFVLRRVALTASLACAGFMKKSAAQKVVSGADEIESKLRRKAP